MQVINWKPILFKNVFNKFFFIKDFNNGKIKNLVNSTAVIDYDTETYKTILSNGLINKLKNNNGSFMVISNLQFAYVSQELEKHNFVVVNIHFLNHFGEIKDIDEVCEERIDEITNFFNFFFSCEHNVNDVMYRNNLESITLYKTGVIRIKTNNISSAYSYIKWIIKAYYKSQGNKYEKLS